jgi:hypothetical protein
MMKEACRGSAFIIDDIRDLVIDPSGVTEEEKGNDVRGHNAFQANCNYLNETNTLVMLNEDPRALLLQILQNGRGGDQLSCMVLFRLCLSNLGWIYQSLNKFGSNFLHYAAEKKLYSALRLALAINAIAQMYRTDYDYNNLCARLLLTTNTIGISAIHYALKVAKPLDGAVVYSLRLIRKSDCHLDFEKVVPRLKAEPNFSKNPIALCWLEVYPILLYYGFNREKHSPLIYAASHHGKLALCESILCLRPDLKEMRSTNGRTPRFYATEYKDKVPEHMRIFELFTQSNNSNNNDERRSNNNTNSSNC